MTLTTDTPPPTVDPPTDDHGGGEGLIRLTVNLVPTAWQALCDAAEREHDTKTDTVNRALQVYNLVLDLMAKGGGKLSLTHGDGTHETVYIL